MSKDVITKILMFAAGAGIGAAITWKLLKTKYEQIAAEEIESVKEAFSNREQKTEEGNTEQEEDELAEDGDDIYPNEAIAKAAEIARKAGYTNEPAEDEKEEDDDMDKPYVIAPEEFGEMDYALQSFTYYADGVVTNERGKIVKNVDELIGEESLQHFGEYEDDSVFVRNDKAKIDFEILKDYREFSEIS